MPRYSQLGHGESLGQALERLLRNVERGRVPHVVSGKITREYKERPTLVCLQWAAPGRHAPCPTYPIYISCASDIERLGQLCASWPRHSPCDDAEAGHE